MMKMCSNPQCSLQAHVWISEASTARPSSAPASLIDRAGCAQLNVKSQLFTVYKTALEVLH